MELFEVLGEKEISKMKYEYDKNFKKIATNMPFNGVICKLSRNSMDKMLRNTELPKEVQARDFTIRGYQNEEISVKEIAPKNPEEHAILILHGGGFGYKMAPYQLLNACHYAIQLRCRVYLPDYHLLPEYPAPAAVEDALATYQYIVSHAKKLEINPEKIIVLGDSAGGALAANVCNMAQAKGMPRPCAQVLIYPVIDNAMNTESMKQFPDTPLWNAKNNKKMWKMYLKDATEEEIRVAVPMKNSLPETLSPTYIETTEFDCLRDEALAYAEHIRNVAEYIEVNETKGTLHGYDCLFEHPTVQDSLEKRVKFMEKSLGL